ncbi:MAG: fructose-2,6-bisphosphatase [uncultured archaeon A07HB70]|nr:MAG: fructose-2,6-bisphosphatase [uncultured archaeon A07HB70]
MGRILFARHAETTWGSEERLQGWAPVQLTDGGREQAAALAGALADRDPDRLLAADLHPALRTAQPVAEATGLDPVPDHAWRAQDLGRLQGLPAAEALEQFPRFSVARRGEAALTERPDGGESSRAASDRVLDAVDGLVAELGAAETVVVVTYGGVVRTVRGEVRDEDVAPTVERSVPPASVTVVAVEDGTRSVVAADETDHL